MNSIFPFRFIPVEIQSKVGKSIEGKLIIAWKLLQSFNTILVNP